MLGKASPVIALMLLTLTSCGGSDKEEPKPSASPEPQPTTYAQRILGAIDRGAIVKTRSDMLAVATALADYSIQDGEYPDASYGELTQKLSPTFIKILPPRDAWGNAFVYELTADGWSLTAPGDDGRAGTGDDIILTDGGFTKLPDGYRDM